VTFRLSPSRRRFLLWLCVDVSEVSSLDSSRLLFVGYFVRRFVDRAFVTVMETKRRDNERRDPDATVDRFLDVELLIYSYTSTMTAPLSLLISSEEVRALVSEQTHN